MIFVRMALKTATLVLVSMAMAALTTAPAHGAVSAPRAAVLGAQAYVYGFPLMEFLRVRATTTSVSCPDGRGGGPVNTISNIERFASASSRTVVAPNVDTLYSLAQLDLGDGPVVLEHPDMGDRYFVFQLLDPYTNTVGYIGSRTTGSSAGRFAITWSGAPGPVVPGTVPITVESRRIQIIGRTLAGDDEDQQVAISLMRQYELTPPGGPVVLPDPCPSETRVEAETPRGLAFLDALSTAMEENPPPERDASMLARLAPVGVGPGLRVDQARLKRWSRQALSAGVRRTASGLPRLVEFNSTLSILRTRGWTVPPSNIGNYGTDYLTRAGVAQVGLGANTPEEALYQTAYYDSRGLSLNGSRSYRLRFPPGSEPPADAFWSVTVYDQNGYLVPNPEKRYAVTSSRPPFVRRADGSVDIIFSATRPADPDVNWLAVPSGRFRAYLRIYSPRPEALSGAWSAPSIQRISGLTRFGG